VFLEGGENGWMEGLEPEVDEVVIHKKCPSAFFGTNLLTQLHVLGVDTLVISGVCTSEAVRATALDTMQSGLRAMVRTAWWWMILGRLADGGHRLSRQLAAIGRERRTFQICTILTPSTET